MISSSPLLEHDAMYMKVIYERMLTKRIAKEARLKRNNKASEAVEEEEDLAEDLELEDIDKPPKIKLRNKGGKAPETSKPASPKGDKKATKKK